MKSFLMAVLLLAAAMAGCTDDAPAHQPVPDFTCDDGTVVDAENMTGHHNDTFDPAASCAAPVALPASIEVVGLPSASLTYSPVNLEWLLYSNETEPHAMLTEVRASRTSVADADLAGPDSFGERLVAYEHQNFENGASYTGAWTPNVPGTYFIRAYALVFGSDIWSAETAIIIEPVQPTGNTVTVTIGVGGPLLATATPATAEAKLGDALVFQNDDVVEHVFNWTGGPVDLAPFTVAAGAASEPVLLLVPGTYAYESADVRPIAGSINVSA